MNIMNFARTAVLLLSVQALLNSGAPVEGVILIFAMEDGRLTSRHLTPEEIYERCTNPKWWMTQRMSRQIQERGPLPANPNDSKASH